MYNTEDVGIFIAELNAPYENGRLFYDNVVRPLFKDYKDDLFTNRVDLLSSDSFYSPKAYCLLGNYDLAVISLIDDFHFGAKYFHPYGKEQESDAKISRDALDKLHRKGFNYHITVGTSSSKETDYLIETANRTFLNKKERFPFIGISNIKVKNSLMIGAGYGIVQLALSALKRILTDFTIGKNMDYLIFEPVSWHELSIIFFSDNLKNISDALLIIREIDVKYATENTEKEFLQRAQEICDEVCQLSIKKTLSDDCSKDEILVSHLFTHTYSNLGIDLEWLCQFPGSQSENVLIDGFKPAIFDNAFAAFTRWFIKPCYLEKFLHKHNDKDQFNLVIGNGDIEASQSKERPINNLLREMKSFMMPAESSDSSNSASIRKTKTIPRFSYDVSHVNNLLASYNLSKSSVGQTDDNSISDKLSELTFYPDVIGRVRSNLIRLKVSKPLRERIINAYINFNDGIQDPILYSNFVELRHYLIFLVKMIEVDTKEQLNEDSELRHAKYNNYIEYYDDAYKTNIVHSYRLYSVTDFNLDYNGGIQPILSGFDAVFKFYKWRYGNSPDQQGRGLFPSITVISGMPVIKTVGQTLRINYNYLFNPEFFLAALPKEAVNHYFVGHAGLETDIGAKLKKVALLYRTGNLHTANLLVNDILSEKPDLAARAAIYMIENAKEQIASEFKIKLLAKIADHNDLQQRMLLLEYVESINSQSFFYFLEDQFAAAILGVENYLFWAWAIYSQESDAYNRDLTLREEKLHRLLIRLSIIKPLTRGSHADIYERLSETHELIVNHHKKTIDIFTGKLMETEVIHGVRVEDTIKYVRGLIAELGLGTSRDTTVVEKVKERLLLGDVSLKREECTFDFIPCLVEAYLDLIKEMLPQRNRVLPRCSDNGLPIIPDNESYQNKLFLDPTGGTFTTGTMVRRRYFKLRNTLMKVLFNFSLHRKELLFTK